MSTLTQALSELCEIRSGGTPLRSRSDFYNGRIPWAKISDLDSCTGIITETEETLTEEGLAAIKGRIFGPGTLLFAIYGSIGKMAFAGRPISTNQAILGIEIKEKCRLHDRFLFHWLSSKRKQFLRDGQGIAQKNLSAAYLRDLFIPLPPINEQRRVAAILDEAEALLRKRKRALALLDGLTRSIFLEMFGETDQWPSVTFDRLLLSPLRNGISPAKGGTANCKVLTLSAITSAKFRAEAWKEAMFTISPSPQQRVKEGEFLLCRGNGNREMVGVGVLSPVSMSDTAFPDTIICADIDSASMNQYFFEYVWNSPATRRQIERVARTTNGTFKINQSVLGGIRLPVPPRDKQNAFGEMRRAITATEVRARTDANSSSSLFSSLQHRAFSGQL